jgi:hypothetical protein
MPSRPQSTRRTALISLVLAGTALAAVAPTSAGAAAVEPDRACYLQGSRVGVSAAGFQANAPITVRRDGEVIGTATTDAIGSVQARFDAPKVPAGERETSSVVELSDGVTRATTRLPVTRFDATFSPASGDPASLMVRFSVAGFGLLNAQPDVYVHYVGPGGRLRQSVKLGRAAGVCGHLVAPQRRRLFPFRAAAGTWILQFDTRKTYRKGRTDRPGFLFFTRRVRVVPS